MTVRVGCVLGVIAFLAICVIAALYPTTTALAIFGAVLVLGVSHLRDRRRETRRYRKGSR